jgi:hypothetical protein
VRYCPGSINQRRDFHVTLEYTVEKTEDHMCNCSLASFGTDIEGEKAHSRPTRKGASQTRISFPMSGGMDPLERTGIGQVFYSSAGCPNVPVKFPGYIVP